MISVLIISLMSLALTVTNGQVPAGCDDNVYEVRMLAFMNLTTDLKTNDGFQEFFYLATNQSNECPTIARTQVPRINIDSSQTLWGGNNFSFYLKVAVDFSAAIGAGVFKGGIQVTSNGPLVAYGHKVSQGTGDSYLALPLSKDSLRHLVVSYNHIEEGHSSFVVGAVYDDTCIEAWHRVNGVMQRILRVSLNAFEVYHTMSTNKEDFTGVVVISTRPISVFGGHECANVPVNVKFCDHLVEQMPATADLGKVHPVPPIGGRWSGAGYVLRIVADKDNTTVEYFNPIDAPPQVALLDEGEYVQFNSSDSLLPGLVTCSEPCLVAQYNTGRRSGGYVSGPFAAVFTDPFLMLVPAIDHWVPLMRGQGQSLWHQGSTIPFNDYLTVAAPTVNAATSVLFNGVPFQPDPSEWILGADGISFAYRAIDNNTWTVTHAQGENIMGWQYGHNFEEPTAYGHVTGFHVQNPIRYAKFYNFTPPADPNGSGNGDGTGNGGGGIVPAICQASDVFNSQNSDVGPGIIMVFDIMFDTPHSAGDSACVAQFEQNMNNQISITTTDDLNGKICSREFCTTRNGPIGIFGFNSVQLTNSAGEITGFQVQLQMAAYSDEPTINILACKKQLEHYFQTEFSSPSTLSSGFCPGLTSTLKLGPGAGTGNSWRCPVS